MIQLLDVFGFLSVILRGLTLALQSLVIGGLVFELFIARGVRGPHGDVGDQPAAAARAGRRLLLGSALCLAVAQAGYVAADTALLMATTGLGLAAVAGANFFVAGAAAAILALVIAALVFKAGRQERPALAGALLLSLGLLAASVATSHAAARLEGRALPLALTSLHMAATGCWIGGLPYLLLALARVPGAAAARTVASRFSRLAQGSVAALLGAGIGLAVIYVGSPAAILGTAYGAMVSAKAILLALLLGLGALNYYVVRRALAGDTSGLASLRRFAEAEVGIGFTVILAAASLTSQPPAADLAPRDLVSLPEIEARMAPRLPRLAPPSASDRLPLSLRGAASGGDRHAVDTYLSYVPGQLVEPATPGEIALSEFNHNVSGLVVLIAGLLAVAARAGWRWARNWPLAFLALAVFLFLLADAEYWPLGPVPFWRGFLVAEALQHRLAVLLIVAFAFYERRVQTGSAVAPATALVFPFVCFLGGALLLTHSHGLNNPKNELLVELSHASIAILGVAAGWSRWLELRLPDGPRRALSWVWPVCFVLVGALLLDYRES
ncbi:MAG TPA: CopD family protein [Thermoanaerobaculia bacterium]|jgi:putative copper resistance protein D|nr:CopD family protein [Thermoanaerobaculia bacterium]